MASDIAELYRLDTVFLPGGLIVHDIAGSNARTERWKNIKMLGKGGFGEVVLQEETSTHEQRAVKSLSKPSTNNQVSTDIPYFFQELHAIALLSKKYDDSFVRLIGWYEDQRTYFLAMEYFEHGDLAGCMQNMPGGIIPEAGVRSIAAQVLQGLARMHSRNFTHRDLKPQNIFVSSRTGQDWRVKIGDFGISKRVGKGNTTGLHTLVGTGYYMAPEVLMINEEVVEDSANEEEDHETLRDIVYTNAVDLWSFGCMVYELLTGKRPFKSQAYVLAFAKGRIKFPQAALVRRNLGEHCIEFLRSLLSLNPGDRPSAEVAQKMAWLAEIVPAVDEKGPTEALDDGIRSSAISPDTTIRPIHVAKSTRTMTSFHPEHNTANPPARSPTSSPNSEHHKNAASVSLQEQFPDVDSALLDEQLTLDVTEDQLTEDELDEEILPQIHSSPKSDRMIRSEITGGAMVALIHHTQAVTEPTDALSNPVPTAAAAESVRETIGQLDSPPPVVTKSDTVSMTNSQMTKVEARDLLRTVCRSWFTDDDDDTETALFLPGIYSSMTPLHWAVAQNDEIETRRLLSGGFDVNYCQTPMLWTPLHVATVCGAANIVKLLLDKGGDLSAIDRDKRTALHCAVNGANIGTVTLLLQRGARIDARNEWGGTPLHLAARRGSMDVVTLLVENGADVEAASENHCTPLYIAAEKGHEDVVVQLLVNGAKIDAKSKDGCTPLYVAADKGYEKVVLQLLDRGADTEITLEEQWTPLLVAVVNGNEAMVKLLLGKGANLEARNTTQRNPLYVAAENGHVAIAKLLLDSGANPSMTTEGWTPLHKASINDHEAIVKLLLCNGADINSLLHDKATSLYLATESGHEAVVRLLLNSHADPDLALDIGMTPLMKASANGYEAIVKLLLAQGANANMTGPSRATALYYAAWMGHEPVATLLLDSHADPNLTMDDGWSPLMKSSLEGHAAVVNLLLTRGANANSTNLGEATALYYAVFKGHIAIVRLLLDSHADPNSSYNRWTPLLEASHEGHEAIVKLLLTRGANANLTHPARATALYYAVSKGHIAIVRLLLDSHADPNSTYEEWTSLMKASGDGHEAIVKLLLARGASPKLKNGNGETARAIAKRKDHQNIVKLLPRW